MDAAGAMVAGRLPAPMTVTPLSVTTVVSGTEPATLPPSGPAARSTTTAPARMSFTVSSVTRTGGRPPGTWAVVMTTSARAMCSASAACCARPSSSVRARAYPPSPDPLAAPGRSTNRAPSDSTSPRACGRTSYALTTAPRRRAVPMACSPATPVPSTRTPAGRIVPAAVVSSGKNPPYAVAATSAALYPATLACEVRASMGWARLSVRGSRSRLTAVTPAAAHAATSSGRRCGWSRPTSACPARSASAGGCTHTMMSAVAITSARLARRAPACAYASSSNHACAPAPVCTTTPVGSRDMTPGTRATRRSPGVSSRTTPTVSSDMPSPLLARPGSARAGGPAQGRRSGPAGRRPLPPRAVPPLR